ncbi:hypothetical protein Bca52824_023842 [Brassica carinata]|uniref:Uncharacterized protein n=1 Tax=Brassica carinata TaxID=52824 RepID=A0A8X7VJX6_BRACI|nr:hypothetical protein Bca52824_023842 [Brassica carinata]
MLLIDILLNRSVMETLGRRNSSESSSLPWSRWSSGYPSASEEVKSDGDSETKKKSSGLSKIAVVAIVLCDVVGICLVGLLFTYCNSKFCACNNRDRHSKKRATECLCFQKHESETLSENMEHCDIVALDAQVVFNLEKLLKALQLDLALPAP